LGKFWRRLPPPKPCALQPTGPSGKSRHAAKEPLR
jgi:hypothetical protein